MRFKGMKIVFTRLEPTKPKKIQESDSLSSSSPSATAADKTDEQDKVAAADAASEELAKITLGADRYATTNLGAILFPLIVGFAVRTLVMTSTPLGIPGSSPRSPPACKCPSRPSSVSLPHGPLPLASGMPGVRVDVSATLHQSQAEECGAPALEVPLLQICEHLYRWSHSSLPPFLLILFLLSAPTLSLLT
jgi:hypothetical protein